MQSNTAGCRPLRVGQARGSIRARLSVAKKFLAPALSPAFALVPDRQVDAVQPGRFAVVGPRVLTARSEWVTRPSTGLRLRNATVSASATSRQQAFVAPWPAACSASMEGPRSSDLPGKESRGSLACHVVLTQGPVLPAQLESTVRSSVVRPGRSPATGILAFHGLRFGHPFRACALIVDVRQTGGSPAPRSRCLHASR